MSKEIFDLDGKVAVVTGASRGIGEAIAKLLAEYGAHVIVTSRRIEGCQAVVDAIRAEGNSAEAMACNIPNGTRDNHIRAVSRPIDLSDLPGFHFIVLFEQWFWRWRDILGTGRFPGDTAIIAG